YLIGLQFLRRRKSALIDGAGDDARDLSAHLATWLDERSRADRIGREAIPRPVPNVSEPGYPVLSN
ncbi:MAG TPA: hypothetical protein VK973_15565, partial [Arenicellales bacterium]|nr:hypothetical protein [Arenicellales bacterium]